MNAKETIQKTLDDPTLQKMLWDASDTIFDLAEPGYKEAESSVLLGQLLQKQGFTVTQPYAGLPTAFKAVYDVQGGTAAGGPEIGLLCEYDALAMGHACAHHLQGPAILGAATALKAACHFPVRISVIGTPAEECDDGGKNAMDEKGAFDSLDFSLMVHGGDDYQIDDTSLALMEADVEFFGTSSHSGTSPEEGRSALEAALLMQNAIGFLRGRVPRDVRITAIILEGGQNVNAVPAYCKCKVELRADDVRTLDAVMPRVEKIVQGVCLASEVTSKITPVARLRNTVVCQTLGTAVLDAAEEMGLAAVRRLNRCGSTDYGAVGFKVPSCCLRLPYVINGAPAHTEDWLAAGKSPLAHASIIGGAKAIALAAYHVAADNALYATIKEDHAALTGGKG